MNKIRNKHWDLGYYDTMVLLIAVSRGPKAYDPMRLLSLWSDN